MTGTIPIINDASKGPINKPDNPKVITPPKTDATKYSGNEKIRWDKCD